MDYLPVQASSVPCEHVFSSSGETDSKKRNWLALGLMEGLQIRKYHLKKDRLDFVKHWVTPVTDLTPDDEVEDVVTNDCEAWTMTESYAELCSESACTFSWCSTIKIM